MTEEQIDLSRYSRVFGTGYCDCPTREGQETGYAGALAEIKNGYKATCWMWWVFPLLKGLWINSKRNKYYGLRGLAEARAFLADPYLGRCLREITGELLKLESSDPLYVFGPLDEPKLQSCMTLFEHVDGEPDNIFARVLEKYFKGERHPDTLEAIRRERCSGGSAIQR